MKIREKMKLIIEPNGLLSGMSIVVVMIRQLHKILVV